MFGRAMSVEAIMEQVINPGATAFWGAWGEVSDNRGVHSLRPATEAEWKVAENGAATVAEAARLLLLPPRRVDDLDWTTYARSLSDVATEALEATKAKDYERMGEVGERLDKACEACHQKYAH